MLADYYQRKIGIMIAQRKPTYIEVTSLYKNLREEFRDVSHENPLHHDQQK
jgi:hypothetical protein